MAKGKDLPPVATDEENKIAASSTTVIHPKLSLSSSVINTVMHLTKIAPRNLFTGHNIYQWRRWVERTLKPRKLEGHLTNFRPHEDDAQYYKWLEEEEILITWILDSMKPEICDRFIDYAFVKEIWETIIRLYSKLEDESRMAELNIKSIELRQEQQGVLEYSNELTVIWNEIDFYRPLPTDPTGREYVLKGRTYAFLTGLRPEFETIRSFLLNRERSASFDESVIHVIKEESRLQAMQAPNRQESQIFLTKSATTTPIPNISTNGQGQSNYTGTVQMPPKQSYNQAKKGYQ